MMKRIAIMAAACTATLVVIVAWNMKTDGHAYRAERKFAYWHSPVLTNEFGGVRQSEYSGPAAEEIVAPLLAGRDGGFLDGVVKEFLATHPAKGHDVDAISRAVAAAEVCVVGRPIPVVRLSIAAASSELANGLADAYITSLKKRNSEMQDKMWSSAIGQVASEIARLRKQMDGSSAAVEDSCQAQLRKTISCLEADLQRMKDDKGKYDMLIQVLPDKGQ